MGNPVLEIRLDIVRANASIILNACREKGIEVTAVVKGFNGIAPIAKAICEAGFKSLGSSRLLHLESVKECCYLARTMSLRISMPSEVPDVVRCADVSLESELQTIAALDKEAGSQGKVHGVILMHDVGDLREGIFGEELLVETAVRVEREFPNIRLEGVGTNLNCYGSVTPTNENLSQLVRCSGEIESLIGRKLDAVSGGASTSIMPMLSGGMPAGINHLRIGSAIMLRSEAMGLPDDELPGLSNDTMTLYAEIVELGSKPTHPIGVLDVDCFGNRRSYEDRGIRKRALLALGAFDTGDTSKLVPRDKNAKILGSSSDHTIVDIHDSAIDYKLGDTIAFGLSYQPMLFSTANGLVEKRFKEGP